MSVNTRQSNKQEITLGSLQNPTKAGIKASQAEVLQDLQLLFEDNPRQLLKNTTRNSQDFPDTKKRTKNIRQRFRNTHKPPENVAGVLGLASFLAEIETSNPSKPVLPPKKKHKHSKPQVPKAMEFQSFMGLGLGMVGHGMLENPLKVSQDNHLRRDRFPRAATHLSIAFSIRRLQRETSF